VNQKTKGVDSVKKLAKVRGDSLLKTKELIMFGILLLAFIGLAVFYAVISVYNSLISLRNHFKNAFAQIDVQLQRRYELIPNLVEAVKAYLSHEKDTLNSSDCGA
jgi:hypothetical protein